MKKIIVLSLTLIILFSVKASAQAQLETYVQLSQNGKAVPDINLYGEKKFSDSSKVSLSYFLLVEQKWAEGLVGIDYYPAKWIAVGAMVGIEQNDALYRFYGSLWLGKDKTSLLLLFEKGHGAGNYWYKHTFSYELSDKVTIAARAWRFNGVGPVLKLTPKKSGPSFFTMPCYDFESKQKRIILGLSIKV